MSFDSHFENRNRSRNGDHRSPYYDSRRFDWGCRHGGSCEYCRGNRTFSNRRREPIIDEDLLSRQSFAD